LNGESDNPHLNRGPANRVSRNGSHRARKRFGQNFLQDESVIQAIVANLNLKPEDRLVEIGPGLGALTKPLLAAVNSLTVVELDRDLAAGLRELDTPEKLNIHSADALQFDFRALQNDKPNAQKLRLVGNLPYNISTPLLFHLLSFQDIIQDMHFMLQKEVVNRLVATPGNKSFGRLSVMFQHYCVAEAIMEVPPQAFSPAPKVDSAVIRLTPKAADQIDPIDFTQLEQLVRQAFSARRKTLRNNLKGLLSHDELVASGFNPAARAESLDVKDFVTLAYLSNQ